MSLTIQHLEKLQYENPNLKFELQDGEIIVMSPSDYLSEEVGGELLSILRNWVKSRGLGRITGSSAGFILPNGNLLAPDVAFVCAAKLKESPRSYAEVVPDLVVEVKSKSDRLKKLKQKIEQFIELGVGVAILIDPDTHQLQIYRQNANPVELGDNDTLTIPELFPGWEIKVKDLWPVVF